MTRRGFVALALLFALGCGSTREEQVVATLYFGAARPGGVVSDDEWRAFVDEVITPRFPGLTAWSGTGHWKGAREETRIVQIVHPPGPPHDRLLAEIIAEYKKRFEQESVLLVRSRSHATFH